MNAEHGVPSDSPRLTPFPASVDRDGPHQRSLAGPWSFVAAPPGSPPESEADWRAHEVPGQWATDGYAVDESAGEVGWYRREFRVSATHSGRTKLRFGAVYSDATVWVNGEQVGHHEGGYTPFELDVTDVVEPGANRLSVAVREGSLAADLDWGNVTGGITRDVTLITVPDVHLSRFHVETVVPDAVMTSGDQGEATERATVRALVTVVNEGEERVESPTLDTALTAPDGSPVASVEQSLDALDPGESRDRTVELDVRDPTYWTPETPACYETACGVTGDDDRVAASRTTGIRSITVSGTQLRLNGTPVTLRGVNWEEVDPEDGGVISPAQTRRDAERLRRANVNYVRPHTYPPTEAFLEACDDLGILVQVELPFTFLREETAERADDEAYRDLMRRAALETVERDRSHPSVLLWSIANESEWGVNFEVVSEAVAAADPTRPQTFNWAEYAEDDADHCAVGNHHYPEMRVPGPPTVADFDGVDRPICFDEFAHVYCYNHSELLTDPGLRDDWGRFLEPIWETVRAGDAVAGGAIFAGIDHGHPEFRWGLLDVYRRERPEYWHVKKVYAPVRATLEERPEDGLGVELENRQDFLSLDAHRIEWTRGEESGTLSVDVAPGESGSVSIPAVPEAGTPVELRVVDDDGFVLDSDRFTPEQENATLPADPQAGTVTREFSDRVALDAGELADWAVNDATGQVFASRDGQCVLVCLPTPVVTPLEAGRTGPHQSAEPIDGRLADWTVESVTVDDEAVRIEGSGEGIDAALTLRPLTDGWVRLAYDLTVTEARTAREVGLALDLPSGHETLTWEREAHWSVYPAGHIGRAEGVATAFPSGLRAVDGDRDPSRPWAHDVTSRGSNDFRGAKRNVRRASLTDEDDGSGLALRTGGDEHVRAAVCDDSVRLWVLARSLAGSGGEWFDRNATVGEDPQLSAGTTISGTVDLRPTDG